MVETSQALTMTSPSTSSENPEKRNMTDIFEGLKEQFYKILSEKDNHKVTKSEENGNLAVRNTMVGDKMYNFSEA